MKRTVLVLPPVCAILHSFAAGPSWAQEPDSVYDLEQCIRTALENSLELRISSDVQQGAEASADEAKAQRWPTLSIGAEASYVSAVNDVQLPGQPPRTLRFGDNESYGITAGVEAPLYSGGALSATETAQRADATAALYDAAADSHRVVHDVRAGFFVALGAQAEIDAAAVAVQRLQRHLDELEGLIRAGAASDEDRLQTQSRLRAAEQRLVLAREQRSVACLQLGRLMGLPLQPVAPDGSLDRSLLLTPPGESEADAVNSRPELHALTLRLRANEARRRAAKGAFLPSVAVYAQAHYARPGVRVLDNEWMDWASAGIALRWTLWDAGGRSARVRQLHASTRALAHRQASVERQLHSALAVSRAQMTSRREQMQKAQQRVELDQERLRLVEGRYQEGLGTQSELLDVQDDLAESEIDLATARVRLRLAEVDLLYAVAR